MTLFKQIIIIFFIILFILFSSTFYVGIGNARDYLREQLASHAQDAATSLGIALTAEIKDRDLATLEVYTNAMFDSGYYTEIEIRDIDGNVLFDKRQDMVIDNVPTWFIQLFPLEAPFQEATVEDGWQTVGIIRIQSYPAVAYEKLWKNIINILQIYLLVMIAVSILAVFLLKNLLKPLVAIRQQARAICNREFSTIDIKPKTVEFQQVVNAFNTMSEKLKTIFEEQAKVTEALKKQAFQDELTGLPNRSMFIKQLKYFCESRNDRKQGCLIIMQLNDLVQVNKEFGHIKANDLLKKLAELMNNVSEQYSSEMVARLSGSEFAILIESVNTDVILQLGKTLQNKLADIAREMQFKNEDIAHIGMVTTQDGQSMGELMTRADMALKLAQQKGVNAFHLYDSKQSAGIHTHGSDEWLSIIDEAIKHDHFELYYQKTVDNNNNTVFQEVMLRLNYDNQIVSAGIFIPMAEHLQITHQIDRWVIAKIVERIKITEQTIYCINLSRNTLQDASFPIWLKEQLDTLSVSQQQRLVIEAPEYNIIKALAQYKSLLFILEPYQCRFSIDHFGIGFASMAYLKDIKVDYIKVHGSYASNIQDNNDIINYMRQIINTAHNLEIKIIAEGIEHEEDLIILREMKLDYYQGYYIGKPSADEQ